MNAEYVEEQLDKLLPSEREKCLLDLSLGGEMTDEKFNTLTDGLDLDTDNQNYLLMLSSLGFTRGWEKFPSEIVPRLKGLHRYHQAHISMGIPWLVSQIRILADEGIPVMLIKGVAVLTYYSPSRPRLMFDYDFAVPEEQYERATELLLKNGNTLGYRAPHSVAVKGPRDSIDLHRWIFKIHNEQFSDIWERAETFSLHGADVRVLSREDMFLHLMNTQSHNYFGTESAERQLQWLYDCYDIWNFSNKLNLESLSERAKELHITNRVRMMLRLFMKSFPGLIAPEEFERAFPRTPEYDKLLIDGYKNKIASEKYRSYGYDKDSAVTPLHIMRGLRFEMINYKYLKPELHSIDRDMNFLGFIKWKYSIDDFSAIAKDYLSRIRLFEKRKEKS